MVVVCLLKKVVDIWSKVYVKNARLLPYTYKIWCLLLINHSINRRNIGSVEVHTNVEMKYSNNLTSSAPKKISGLKQAGYVMEPTYGQAGR